MLRNLNKKYKAFFTEGEFLIMRNGYEHLISQKSSLNKYLIENKDQMNIIPELDSGTKEILGNLKKVNNLSFISGSHMNMLSILEQQKSNNIRSIVQGTYSMAE